ncbi:MAG: hypothetical protein KDE24_29815 [Caldilinea sp.]|nr:hypothetical protein [Caldilinea sp.]
MNLAEYLAEQRRREAPWNSLYRPRKAVAIKQVLRTAFHDKCGYCEQIEAQTIDHYRPQARDIDARWDWDNFVLACTVCQSYKLAQEPFDEDGNWMVNPRIDEPMDYLFFDLATGTVVAQVTSTQNEARGTITIRILGLDRRSRLQDERRRKVLDVLAHALAVIRALSPQDEDTAWRALVDHLHVNAPYLGIIRQLLLTENRYAPIFTALRSKRPEFDSLISDWCSPRRS